MFKKSVIFVSLLFLCLAFADFAFGDYALVDNSPREQDPDQERTELVFYRDVYSTPLTDTEVNDNRIELDVNFHADADSDGLTNAEELKLGTNPFNEDTDFDFVSDGVEVRYGTDPNHWDTDGDNLADYMEMDPSSSTTSPFEQDTDNDGLPDPWEDNDRDGILNLEEQDPKFKLGILGTNPNLQDSDGDGVVDSHEIQAYAPGPISKNAKDIGGRIQISITPDRNNSACSVAPPYTSPLAKHLKSIGWTDGNLKYFYDGLINAFKHQVLPFNTSSIVWYHCSPAIGPIPADYNWTIPSQPFHWNRYDTNPALNDTDGDIMDDDWDPRPLIPDDRLDAYIAINQITHRGKTFSADPPTNKNFTGAFKANFSSLEITKGDIITLELWLGLEDTPDNDPVKIPNAWWRPINISIRFGMFQLGSDNRSHGDLVADDFRGDDIWPNLNDTALPAIADRPWVAVSSANYETSYPFINTTGKTSTMYFYSQIISIFVPADLPAGIIGFILRANPNTGENFYYESYPWPFVAY